MCAGPIRKVRCATRLYFVDVPRARRASRALVFSAQLGRCPEETLLPRQQYCKRRDWPKPEVAAFCRTREIARRTYFDAFFPF